MIEQNVDTLMTAVGSLVTGLVGAAFWIRKAKPGFAKDDLTTKQAEADLGVIERLERECKRLSDQNEKLANLVNEFQLQILRLQTENNRMSLENSALKQENVALREEIIELKNDIAELTKLVSEMQQSRPACATCPQWNQR